MKTAASRETAAGPDLLKTQPEAKFGFRLVLTQRLFSRFPNFNFVKMVSLHRDAVFVIIRGSTCLQRQFRDCICSTQEKVGPKTCQGSGEGRSALSRVLPDRAGGCQVLCDVAGVFETKALTETKVVPTPIRWRGAPQTMHSKQKAARAHRLEVLPVPREALQGKSHVLV